MSSWTGLTAGLDTFGKRKISYDAENQFIIPGHSACSKVTISESMGMRFVIFTCEFSMSAINVPAGVKQNLMNAWSLSTFKGVTCASAHTCVHVRVRVRVCMCGGDEAGALQV